MCRDVIRSTQTSCAIIYADGNTKCHKAQADRLGWGVSLLLSLLAQDFATLRKQDERREYRTVLQMVTMREIPVKKGFAAFDEPLWKWWAILDSDQ